MGIKVPFTNWELLKSAEIQDMQKSLQHLENEAYFQKTTPLPDIERLFFSYGGNTPVGMNNAVPLAQIYEAAYNTNELRIIFHNLTRETFRNGWEFKPKWESKCLQCSKEYDYSAETCDVCGYAMTGMSPVKWEEVKQFEKRFTCVNERKQTFRQLMNDLALDVHVANVLYLVLEKEYYYNSRMEIMGAKVKTLNRGNPQNFSMVADKQGRLGYNEENEQVLVCPEHRNNAYSDGTTTNCSCGNKLYPAHYKAKTSEGQSTEEYVYYIEGEVISTSLYYPYPGYSPLNAVWNKVTALRAMDLYVKEYYSKQRPPKGMLLVNTANTDELKKNWEWLLKQTKGNPHAIHPFAVQAPQGSMGNVAQFIDFMNNLSEAQYVEIRQEFTAKIGAQYGVMPLFQGDTSTSGGLNNEGLQVTVTNRAVADCQSIWNEVVFPQLLKQFGVDDFELILLPSEEQDENAEIDRKIKQAELAQRMLTMGFNVELSHDGEDFVYSGKARLPAQQDFNPLAGIMGAPSKDESSQRFEGEPESIGKAMPLTIGRETYHELLKELESEMKRLGISKNTPRDVMLKKMDKFSTKLAKALQEKLNASIMDIYKEGMKSVEKDLGKSLGFGKPDQNAIKLLKSDSIFNEAFTGIESSTKKALYEVIERAYENPERLSIPTLVGDMQATVELEKSRLEMIARTESSFISNAARMVSYSKVDDGSYLYKWIGPQDERTTEVCKELSFSTSSGVPLPQLRTMVKSMSARYGMQARDLVPHINCRHTFVRTLPNIRKSYYGKKFAQHGDSPEAVGWKDEVSQVKRFDEIMKFIPGNARVLDIGCGLGHFHEYAVAKGIGYHYTGIDTEEFFVKTAQSKGLNVIKSNLKDFHGKYDYAVASGTFNTNDSMDLFTGIKKMDSLTTRGFVFNFLESGQYNVLKTYELSKVVDVLHELGYEPEITKGYLPNDVTVLVRKEKVYLSPGQSAPKGKETQTGPSGGKFYETGGSDNQGSDKPAQREANAPARAPTSERDNGPKGAEQPQVPPTQNDIPELSSVSDTSNPQVAEAVASYEQVDSKTMFDTLEDAHYGKIKLTPEQGRGLAWASYKRLHDANPNLVKLESGFTPSPATPAVGAISAITSPVTGPAYAQNNRGAITLDANFARVASPEQQQQVIAREQYRSYLSQKMPGASEHITDVMSYARFGLTLEEQNQINSKLTGK